MCGIAGFYNPHDHYLKEKEHYESVLRAMAERLRHRGPMTPDNGFGNTAACPMPACPSLIWPEVTSPW